MSSQCHFTTLERVNVIFCFHQSKCLIQLGPNVLFFSHQSKCFIYLSRVNVLLKSQYWGNVIIYDLRDVGEVSFFMAGGGGKKCHPQNFFKKFFLGPKFIFKTSFFLNKTSVCHFVCLRLLTLWSGRLNIFITGSRGPILKFPMKSCPSAAILDFSFFLV